MQKITKKESFLIIIRMIINKKTIELTIQISNSKKEHLSTT